MKNRWQLHRAGLLNFWYYDEEEFYFADGKLLLRGSNGSGKSVTMQSLIPVLLDGKKSPDRLDPFGSKARRMEDYLLGEKEVVDRDERTGYLYLEYKRSGTEQYLTTGIGLRAKRHSNLDFWGFVIYDNRRIGQELHLYKTEYSVEEGQEQKIPLTRRELETLLSSGGKVVRTQAEYMELVNKYVFGFESLDAYEDLIKLLIQLRSPKLSKEFKPTVIYEILNESLPALSDEELRPLSDTIENMDQTKQQLDQLMRDQRSLARLCKVYDEYNRFVLAEKADGFLQAHKKQEALIRRHQELVQTLAEKTDLQQTIHESITAFMREQVVLKEEERQLRDHDVFRAEEEKQKIEVQLIETVQQIEHKEMTLRQKLEQERKLQQSIQREELKMVEAEDKVREMLEELEMEANESEFAGHTLNASEFERKYRLGHDLHLWKNEARAYQQKLERVLKVLRVYTNAKDRYNDTDKELADARKDLDLKRNEERRWQQLFEEEKNRYLDSFHRWRKQNQILALNEDEVRTVSQRIMQIYEPYRLEEVREGVTQSYHRMRTDLHSKQVETRHQINAKRQETEAKRLELQEWKTKKDPEPARHPDTLQARRELDAAGIPYVPFFAAVEFRDMVTSEQRERIESAISQMGLLDALIVPERHLQQAIHADRVIKPNPQLFAYTLADLLYPTPVEGVDISSEEIDNVLRSILINEGADSVTVIREDGTYQIGLLHGQAPKEAQSIYIGKESRRRYRQYMIEKLNEELQSLEDDLLSLEEIDSGIQAMLKQLQHEYDSFPSDRDTHEAYATLDDTKRQVQTFLKEVERKNEKLKEAWEHLEKVKKELHEQTEGLSIAVTEEAFETARGFMQDYLRHLQELELAYKDFLNSSASIRQFRENLDEVIADVDELKGERNVLQGKRDTLIQQKDRILERLQELGAEEIRKRIEVVLARLDELPKSINLKTEEKTKLASEIEILEKTIQQNELDKQIMLEILHTWKTVFVEDAKLGFVKLPDSTILTDDEQIVRVAKWVLETYGSSAADSSLDKEKVTERLNRSFFQEQGILVEYRLTQETILEANHLPQVGEDEIFRIQVEQVKQKSRRIQLILEYGGKRVSPYFVLDQMEKDIELQQNLLKEKDRELFEEIIMNSVGRIIRARINRAERWVEMINQLMSERDTSSGLTFSIRWKPRTAEHEEEMDTKELVDLLRSDPRLLREDDMNRMTGHFRSKINRAKELLEDKGYGETFHQMIKEMLDYRKWFSFTLYYRREGEQRKELTNNVFYTFSGGEKAMAMYIPLFSAAYSRYLEAREDAPFIISLDEAFAGVDENNIRDMFDLMEKIGFNYIINSQALWGDYDTVSSLSICELVRPKNAPFVTIIRYHWDGKVKHLLHETPNMNYELEIASSSES